MKIGDVIYCDIEKKNYTVIQICFTTLLAEAVDGEVRQFDYIK
jgi:hypothetical protein